MSTPRRVSVKDGITTLAMDAKGVMDVTIGYNLLTGDPSIRVQLTEPGTDVRKGEVHILDISWEDLSELVQAGLRALTYHARAVDDKNREFLQLAHQWKEQQ